MKIMFCCTGNTCRSPMAEMILIHELNKLNIEGIEVSSSGVMAQAFQLINSKTIQVLTALGVPVEVKSARKLTKNLCDESDMIICMTEAHKNLVVNLYGENNKLLCPKDIDSSLSDISDPFGYEQDTYTLVYNQLSKMIEILINNKLSKLLIADGEELKM